MNWIINLFIYIYIYIYIWYVRIPYMHSALFVRDAIFPHCILGSCITACSRDKTRKAEQWESTQQGLENGEEREALLARPRLIIDGVLRDSATGSAQCTERSACENSNHGGLRDSIKYEQQLEKSL